MLQDVVHKPGSHEALYLALRRHVELLSPVNLTTALSSLAHLDSKLEPKSAGGLGPPLRHGNRGFAEQSTANLGRREPLPVHLKPGAPEAERLLVEHIVEKVKADTDDSLRPRFYADVMYALAKMAQRSPFDLLTPVVCAASARRARDMTARDASMVLWSMAILDLGEHRGEAIRAVSREMTAKARGGQLSPVDLAQSLWSCGKQSHDEAPGLTALALALCEASIGRTGEFPTHSISLSMWALGLLESIQSTPAAQRFVAELSETAASAAKQMNPQMVSNCTWGAARLGLPPTARIFEAMAAVALRQLKERAPTLTDQHVSVVLWSYAKVEVRSPGVLRHMIAVSEEVSSAGKLAAMQNHHISQIVGSFGQCFIKDQEAAGFDLMPPSVVATIEEAGKIAQRNLQTWTASMLLRVTWSLVRAAALEQAVVLMPHIVERFRESPPEELSWKDLTMILWSLSASNMSREHVSVAGFEFLARAVLDRLHHSAPGSGAGGLLASAPAAPAAPVAPAAPAPGVAAAAGLGVAPPPLVAPHASFLACIALACATADLGSSAGAVVEKIAHIAAPSAAAASAALPAFGAGSAAATAPMAGGGGAPSWSRAGDRWLPRHLAMVSMAILLLHRYTPQTAPLVRDTYLLSADGYRRMRPGSPEAEERLPAFSSLRLLWLALRHEAALEAWPLPRALARELLPEAKATRALQITVSSMQSDTRDALLRLRLGREVLTEASIESALSVDLLLPAPAAAPPGGAGRSVGAGAGARAGASL